ncbi:MAG: (Fe-S)-binding protein [Ignavibacteria bacterium]|nr:(Fe-S)-binding protein [Ignavibacteria bacterium]
MELKNIIFTAVFIISSGIFLFNLQKKIKIIKTGKDEYRWDNLTARIKKTAVLCFAQIKIIRQPFAGFIHLAIFWGFIIFLFPVTESFLNGFYSNFSFNLPENISYIFSTVNQVFSVLVLFAVAVAIARRYIIRIKRLQTSKAGNKDALIILFLIAGIVVTMNIQSAAGNHFIPGNELIPITKILSAILPAGAINYSNIILETSWWIHNILILVFLNYLPFSKHFHIITAIPNVFFSKLENKYSIYPINLEDENAESYGAADTNELSWKQILNGFACTECGRCDSVCPAAQTGKPLSPRKIITDIRKRSEEKYKTGSDKKLLGNYASEEEIWSCTSCGACVYECPVEIEHLDTIYELRRNTVLTESRFPAELNGVFRNIENSYNPWGFSNSSRADWAKPLGIKTLAEDADCEWLFWVGCAGSFDERAKKVSAAFSEILYKAGIKFRILGNEEKCNGDTARRLGNEYLAQMLITENIQTIRKYNVKNIVTACPHCFNSLKNDFPQFGGNFKVLHHSEFINELIETGKIVLKEEEKTKKITYHDSCYLGRYNNIYDFPRNPIKLLYKNYFIEQKRNYEKGFCCGAGGGRMFLEEKNSEKININRAIEIEKSGAEEVVSACPFCMTMLNDGFKTINGNKMEVKDIAEIVLENSK